MWVEFVTGSRSCSEDFSPDSLVFLSLQKPTLQIPIPILEAMDEEPNRGICHCKFLFIVIYLFTLLLLLLLLLFFFMKICHPCINAVNPGPLQAY